MTEITVKNAANAPNALSTARNVKSATSAPLMRAPTARIAETVCSLPATTATAASSVTTALRSGAANVKNAWTVPPAATVGIAVPAIATQNCVSCASDALTTAAAVPATRAARPAWCAIWKMMRPARTAEPALSPAMARHTVRNVTPAPSAWVMNTARSASSAMSVPETMKATAPNAASV